MVKKNKTVIEVVDNAPSEVVIIEKIVEHAPVVVETLVKVRSRDNFKDGAFANEFAKYGYKTFWPREEVRELPAQLYAKLQSRSGNRFDIG